MKRVVLFLLMLAALGPPVAMAQTAAAPKIPLTLGFVNFSGPDLAPLVQQDSAALGPLFAGTNVAALGRVPVAPVLFVYAHLQPDGTIRGPKSVGVRQVVEATKAAIVVVASENSSDSITKAGGLPGPKTANIVFTLNRNGSGFANFFRRLFERMRDGEDMMMAWVQLAPQGPIQQDPNLPGTIFVPKGGRLLFPK